MSQLVKEEARLWRVAAWTILLAVLLSVPLSFFVTRAVLKPVRVFTRAADRIGGGVLDFRVEERFGCHELRDFSHRFNLMITELKESREHLMDQISRDFLTGLFNHRSFHERLAQEIDRAERSGRSLCLAVLDLDRFKQLNDNLGHPVGDSVLRQLSGIVQDNVRTIDIPARYGGDELAVIMPETNSEEGLATAERLRSAIESYAFRLAALEGVQVSDSAPEPEGRINLTVTIGLAVYPRHSLTPAGLVMCADIALCRAKHIARNSVSAYEPSVDGEGAVAPEELYRVLDNPDAAAARSLAMALDAKDPYTRGHSDRVTMYAVDMAQRIGTDPDTQDALRLAGVLHDLGKIGVPDAIMNKTSSLTAKEREVIQRHPSVGGDILKRAPQLDVIIPAVLFHHERWDGKGYPDGLVGESIPLMARILALADAFDAMTSDRPYRKAMSLEEALVEIRLCAGSQFDPNLVEDFCKTILSHKLAA